MIQGSELFSKEGLRGEVESLYNPYIIPITPVVSILFSIIPISQYDPNIIPYIVRVEGLGLWA